MWLSTAATGNITLQIYGTGAWVAVWTSSASLPVNQWKRLEARVEVSTTAGVAQAAFYAGDTTTAIDSGGGTSLNTSSTVISNLMVGNYGSDTIAYDRYIDDFAAESGRTSFIGPYTPPVTLAPIAQLNRESSQALSSPLMLY